MKRSPKYVQHGFNVVNRVNRREGVIAHYRQQRERTSLPEESSRQNHSRKFTGELLGHSSAGTAIPVAMGKS
jgi:hypothetical protein